MSQQTFQLLTRRGTTIANRKRMRQYFPMMINSGSLSFPDRPLNHRIYLAPRTLHTVPIRTPRHLHSRLGPAWKPPSRFFAIRGSLRGRLARRLSWGVEQIPGGNTGKENGTLEIDDAKRCTVRFIHKLSGPSMIEYEAFTIQLGGPNDHARDLNCFWMAVDPKYPETFSTTTVGAGSFGIIIL